MDDEFRGMSLKKAVLVSVRQGALDTALFRIIEEVSTKSKINR